MNAKTDFEQYRIDQNPPKELKRIVDEVARTRKIVTSVFGSIRPDAAQVRPPVVIYSDKYFDRVVSPAIGMKLDGPVKYAYQPVLDEIHISLGGATELPIDVTRMFLAEELIHAQTTRVMKDKTRVAYLTIPGARSIRSISRGGVYDLSSSADEAEINDPWKGPESTLRLLERTTMLAVHHLLDALLGRRLPMLLLLRDGKPELVVQKNDDLLELLLDSMYRDDPGLIPKRIFSVLQDPRPITWVSAFTDRGAQRQPVTTVL